MNLNHDDFNFSIPRHIEDLETAMGRYSASFAKTLPVEIQSAAFCSPTSFRDPETDNVWHPYMAHCGFIFFLIMDQIPLLIRSFLSGIMRFLLYRFGSFHFIPSENASVLGVAPVIICKPKGNSVETSYCNQDDIEKITWLLADEKGKEIWGYPISRSRITHYLLKMLFCNLVVSLIHRDKSENLKEWLTASILMFNWIISLQWVHMWIFAIKIREIINTVKPGKIYSLHEMHPHARIAWSEARKRNIPTVTVQHASIVRAKLWYFPTKDELAAGISTPDEFVVFSSEEQKLLQPFYSQKTRFYLNCGPRFSKWKSIKQESQVFGNNTHVLFAGSIPWWDNEVVLKGVQKLLDSSKQNRKIIVRLHPAAIVSKVWKKWLNCKAAIGAVIISNQSLTEDISRSAVVIGMNSTVLDEGALSGLASIKIESDRYLSFSTSIGKHVSLNRLSWKLIEEVILMTSKHQKEFTQQARTHLGIDYPLFKITY